MACFVQYKAIDWDKPQEIVGCKATDFKKDRWRKLYMNVELINPFLNGAIRVLETMAFVQPKVCKPYLKKGYTAVGIFKYPMPILSV